MLSNWYVIHVSSKSECGLCSKINKTVPDNLYKQCFVPQAEYIFKNNGEHEKRTRPLFPGYIFVISDSIESFYEALKKINGYKRILKDDNKFTPISQKEANIIAGITDDDYIIGSSEGYIENSNIIITDGPLKWLKGTIKKIDRHKRTAIVEMTFMGQIQEVQMSLNIISKT